MVRRVDCQPGALLAKRPEMICAGSRAKAWMSVKKKRADGCETPGIRQDSGAAMGKIAQWDFGKGTRFDGRTDFVEIVGEPQKAQSVRRLVIDARAHDASGGILVARGVSGHEDGAFRVVVTTGGAVAVDLTGLRGRSERIVLPDGCVPVGERFVVMVTWPGPRGKGRVTVALPSRPDDRHHLPISEGFSFASGLFLPMSVGAAPDGAGPHFHGTVYRVALWGGATATNAFDAVAEEPALAPPLAEASPAREVGQSAPATSGSPTLPTFAHGTRVATPSGLRNVETLDIGDLVMTRDNGAQPVAWVGRAELDWDTLRRHDHLRPILIRSGAMGPGFPDRDMQVSQNHRLLVPVHLSRLDHDGADEVLIAAKHIVDNRGIHEIDAFGVTYIRLMFAETQLICTNGVWAECVRPDKAGRGQNAQRIEFDELFTTFERIADTSRPRDDG
ncbi:MAG: Hint domain-containing protein [Alphaproteobacteria bacterium]|nr:Hint domain-containing protein [Alphaproteobacteria bacterium]NNF71729.1 Hint domain-containing protein [Paracoccaceae bacterium]